MTTDGWEQRLDDLGQARELRERVMWAIECAWEHLPDLALASECSPEIADALLSGPLAPLLATQEAAERVRGVVAQAGPMIPRAVVRRALDGTP